MALSPTQSESRRVGESSYRSYSTQTGRTARPVRNFIIDCRRFPPICRVDWGAVWRRPAYNERVGTWGGLPYRSGRPRNEHSGHIGAAESPPPGRLSARVSKPMTRPACFTSRCDLLGLKQGECEISDSPSPLNFVPPQRSSWHRWLAIVALLATGMATYWFYRVDPFGGGGAVQPDSTTLQPPPNAPTIEEPSDVIPHNSRDPNARESTNEEPSGVALTGAPDVLPELPAVNWDDDRWGTEPSVVVPPEWPTFPPVLPEPQLRRLERLRDLLRRRQFDFVLEKTAPTAVAMPGAEQEAITRLELVGYHVKRFWTGVDAGLEGLRIDDELVFRELGIRARVVGVTPVSVELEREDGVKKRFSTLRNAISARVAAAIADRHLYDQGASRFLTLAVFWSVDQQGDRNVAAHYWQRALEQGLAVDALDERFREQWQP